MRQRSESGLCQGKWIPGKRAINHYQDEISAETKIRKRTQKKGKTETKGKRIPGKAAIKHYQILLQDKISEQQKMKNKRKLAAYNHIPGANIKELLRTRIANLQI